MTFSEVLGSITLGLVGAASLWGLYRALELNWPVQYASLNDTFALRISQTWWKFGIYRVVPVYLLGVALAVTASRLDLNAATSLICAIVIHLASTNGRALMESFGVLKVRAETRVNYSAYNIIAIVGVAGVAGAAYFSFPFLTAFVPSPQALLDNLWIALFVAVAGGFAIALIGARPDEAPAFAEQYFVDRARRDLGLDLLDHAYRVAVDVRCDPMLFLSLIYAEVLQRPRWVRNLERVKGKIYGPGSYGAMQIQSRTPVSDKESITLGGQRHAGSWGFSNVQGWWAPRDGQVWKAAAAQNEDKNFIGLVQQIYSSLFHQNEAFEFEGGILRILEVRRYPQTFALRAVLIGPRIEVQFETGDGAIGSASEERPTNVPDTSPWAVEISFPIDAHEAQVSVSSPRSGLQSYPVVLDHSI